MLPRLVLNPRALSSWDYRHCAGLIGHMDPSQEQALHFHASIHPEGVALLAFLLFLSFPPLISLPRHRSAAVGVGESIEGGDRGRDGKGI